MGCVSCKGVTTTRILSNGNRILGNANNDPTTGYSSCSPPTGVTGWS